MELIEKLQFIFSQFKVNNNFEDFKTFSSGHINDTYLIISQNKPFYVLQRINGKVFKNVENVILNKVKISNFLIQKKVKTLNFIATNNHQWFYKDASNHFWNLSFYIENSKTFLKATSPKMAFEAGKITGLFLNKTAKFQRDLVDIFPNFHAMSFRLQEFENALKKKNTNRINTSQEYIDFVSLKRNEMLVLDRAIKENQIPVRITHNDTKISNILFSKEQKAICLIDLDTVMNGVIHFDFGDALRTICSTAEEDEKDLSKVDFNLEFFKNYTLGFSESVKKSITENEVSYLPYSIKIMTFIMGLRFLTDYLNEDIYYKTSYNDHNLDRAKNQFTLVKKIEQNQKKIDNFINNIAF